MEAGAAPFTSTLAEELAEPCSSASALRPHRHAVRARARRFPEHAGPARARRLLADELRALGLADAALDANGYVTATLPSTVGRELPAVGLIAHVDTSPDAPGAGVEPIVHRGYDGGVIELPQRRHRLDPATMPELASRPATTS